MGRPMTRARTVRSAEHGSLAVNSGEISGWPLDPNLYRKDDGHTEGIVNGLDIRGMVPGAIPTVKIDPVPEDIPPYLNIP